MSKELVSRLKNSENLAIKKANNLIRPQAKIMKDISTKTINRHQVSS